MAPKLIQCIKFSFPLTAGARFWWINNKSVPHSSSVFACGRGKNTSAPSIVYRLLIGWNCHTTWSQGNQHYMRLHFLQLDREFFCLQPSLARLYFAASSTSERLRSDGSLAIIITYFVRSLTEMSIFLLLNLVRLELRSASELLAWSSDVRGRSRSLSLPSEAKGTANDLGHLRIRLRLNQFSWSK